MALNDKYYRPITHPTYRYKNKVGDKGKDSWLRKDIVSNPGPTDADLVGGKLKYILYLDHQYLSNYTHPQMGARIGGGATAFLTVGFAISKYYYNEEIDGFGSFVGYLCIFLTLFFLVYYFTMPKKELILNRIDGTITFQGWTWMKNTTMPFEEVKFTLDKNALLHVVRPDRIGTIQIVNMGYDHWYGDMSFYVWFMDKNRPLPPGTAFDPYRQKDFERRKAEGFPPPLYRSFISTPEATAEMQAERDRYYQEDIEYFQREINSRWYNPKVDTEWKTVKYMVGKEKRMPMANGCIKYTFEDGLIVYARTNHKGEVPEPPAGIKYRTNKVEVVKN